jgi:hypothetical protein
MNPQIEQLNKTIAPLREQIIGHPLYAEIRDIEDLHLFMQFHSYAVWDFMSLLKALQQQLTCTTVPWFPKGNGDTRYLINEIVLGEESDVDRHGIRKSHFEMYLEAMNQCGVDYGHLTSFIESLQKGLPVTQALAQAGSPESVHRFVSNTFDVIETQKAHVMAAVFTFGREDLIPGMFHAMVQDLNNQSANQIEDFIYYLERHIEVDGDHHSHLALDMTARLCGNDPIKWAEATQAVIQSLKCRLELWDGVLEGIKEKV